MEKIGTMQAALNTINANPCSWFDSAAFPDFNEEQMDAARRAWNAAVYAAAMAIAHPKAA